MRVFLSSFIIVFFIHCTYETNSRDPIVGEKLIEEDNFLNRTNDTVLHLKSNHNKDSFLSCFPPIDSVDSFQKAVGCENRCFYKLINDSQDLMIHYNAKITIDSCTYFDNLTQEIYAELQIFKKGQANLTNQCTDVMIVNVPKPIKRIQANSGELAIAESDIDDYYGNKLPRTTILVKQLNFYESTYMSNIIVTNELFWKVRNFGTSG